MKYEKYITAYIDILGFKELITNTANNAEDNDCQKIFNILKKFKTIENPETLENAYILSAIEEDAQKKNLQDFKIDNITYSICFSDCIAIFVSADDKINERVSTLIALLSKISCELLIEGIFIRGALTYGNLFLDKKSNIFYGQAMNEAYLLEETVVKYPRILLSKKLIDKLNYPLEAKYNRYPYHQYIERFSDGTAGFTPLIYFEVMQSAPSIFTEEKLKSQLQIAKYKILENLDRNLENPPIFEKYNWLKERFNELCISDIECQIRETNIPDAYHNLHYTAVNYWFDKRNK